jgi:hypothetical protein
VLKQGSYAYISPQSALKEGLHIKTATRWYTNGGDLFPKITDGLRPINSPEWIDFEIAFGAEFSEPTKPYLKFPIFSEKILVFNKDISNDLFSYIEDEYMEEETGGGYFTEGLPSKDDLVRQYWKSMLTVEEYSDSKPYKNPEILIFETVPAKLIEYIQ